MTIQNNNSNATPPAVKRIILHNIQSLPDAAIEPAPPGRLTVVIGVSDSGKTTLASRALSKLYFNNYPTKDIVRRKCKSAHISVVYDTPDNLTVSWRWKGKGKGKDEGKKLTADAGKAWWEIARDGMETATLDGGGKRGHVPEAIQQITGVRPVTIGGTTINFNFNKQLDGPFLGAASPAERYRVLGILAGTLEVDAAVKEVGTEIIQARRQETKLAGSGRAGVKGEIRELEEKIKEYGWLDVLGEGIQKIEAALSEVARKQELRNRLDGFREEICAQEEVVQDAEDVVLSLERVVKCAAGILSEVEFKAGTHQRLLSACAGIGEQKSIAAGAEGVLAATKHTAEGQRLLVNAELGNNKLTAMARLHKDIQSEEIKQAVAQEILTDTETLQDALEALKNISEANHTLNGILLPRRAEITKTRAVILRYNHILSQTAGTNQGKEILAQVEAAVEKVYKLQDLGCEIGSAAFDQKTASLTLEVTAEVNKGIEMLAGVEAGLSMLNKLVPLLGKVERENSIVRRADMNLQVFDRQIKTGKAGYRELLLQAGICEGCPVVDEVLAAVD